MAWVEIMPAYESMFRNVGWDTAAPFLAWSGILVNRHRQRRVELVTPPGPPSCFYLKKESGVSWRDRVRNAWHGFGWCATTVREAATLQTLRRAGIGCPEVAALGEAGKQAFMVTRAATDMTELREFLAEPRSAQELSQLADALGQELARVHDAGFDHPDLFAKHILVGATQNSYRFCILDWQRSRHRRIVSWQLRMRDLALLDATLHNLLASDRMRLRCLRAYRNASELRGGAPPLSRLARMIRARSSNMREERNIREHAQLPIPAEDQQFVAVRGGRLLVVRSYFEEFPKGSEVELTLDKKMTPDPFFPEAAHTLFRLHRFGVPAPRLVAVGDDPRPGTLVTRSTPAAPFAETLAKASAPLRARILRDAGAIIRQIHEAGYRLPAGERWSRCLGVVPASGSVVLVKVEPLLRCDLPWEDLAPAELQRERLRLSRTEQLRFLQGYLRRAFHRPRQSSGAGKLSGLTLQSRRIQPSSAGSALESAHERERWAVS